jgi:hypothetical protein
MTPKAFTFKLTVPADPRLAPIVAGVAAHAATYVDLEATAGADFVLRVSAAAAAALAEPAVPPLCTVVVSSSSDTGLTVEIGSATISQRHSA